MEIVAGTDRTALDRVRERRRQLHRALVQLEEAAAVPAGHAAAWCDRLAAALARLESTLDDHVAETEAGGGLFEQVVEVEPRLDPKVGRLRGEHRALADATRRLLARCRGEVAEGGVIERIREDVLDLLREAYRHRQRGADILWEAYEVDVSAGD